MLSKCAIDAYEEEKMRGDDDDDNDEDDESDEEESDEDDVTGDPEPLDPEEIMQLSGNNTWNKVLL